MKLIQFFILLSLVACFGSKNSQKKEVPVSNAVSKFSEDSLTLSFERTMCFGTCPAYKIIVMNDGRCFYEGYKFVEKTGHYTATISAEQFERIKSEAERIDFWNLESNYDAPVTDLPSVIIMFSGPKGRKEIVDRTDAPKELKDFELITDRILLSLDWQKIEAKD